MQSLLLLGILIGYFLVLLGVSYYTSRNATNQSFFQANKSAPWYLVAFGMIGTSLSGVTFISVPGTVGSGAFAYFQVVIGYFIGYFIVAYVLLPLYYKYNLTSIYKFLMLRFGDTSYKTGALLFITSRTLGATLRLYLVINVLQIFVLDELHIPFTVTTLIILGMILMYTYKGGVKTIVWTDTLQTLFMLLALVICVVYILSNLGLSFSDAMQSMSDHGFTNIFKTDPMDKKFFLKQIIGGAFITVSMTGLDQEMMQKNISVRTLGDSQKNMISFSTVMVLVNFLFLLLGGLLYLYAESLGLATKGDDLFPTVAMQHLPPFVGIIFVVGLISALFPSADGAITALTASFCIDILGFERDKESSEEKKTSTRHLVHLSFTGVFLIMVFFFKWLDNKEIITILLDISGYTYGPLLGLFAYGIMTKHPLHDKFVPVVCIVAPIIVFTLDKVVAPVLLGNYKFGLELLLMNGVLTFAGLMLIRKKHEQDVVM
jgi:Na+/proline symporter